MDAVFKTDAGVFNYRVAGVWIEKDHILLHKEVNGCHWSLPGGRVAVMEESNTAVEREFQEELGIQMKVEKFLWSTENFFKYEGKSFHEIGFYYLVTPVTDYQFTRQPFFGIEGERLIYQWVPIEELPSMSLQPAFLKEELKSFSHQAKHIVIKEEINK